MKRTCPALCSHACLPHTCHRRRPHRVQCFTARKRRAAGRLVGPQSLSSGTGGPQSSQHGLRAEGRGRGAVQQVPRRGGSRPGDLLGLTPTRPWVPTSRACVSRSGTVTARVWGAAPVWGVFGKEALGRGSPGTNGPKLPLGRARPTPPVPSSLCDSNLANQLPTANTGKTLTLFMFWIINVAVKIPPVSFD